jgi:Ran GTPase-activating protein (RanGAP) involved in mRNA processing and transport
LDIRIFLDSGPLSKLNLSGNYTIGMIFSNHDSPGFIRPIANALKRNMTITELDLSKNNLNPEAAKILAEGIQDSGSMSNLHIGCNEIPEEQMRVFIAMDKFDVFCAVPIKKLKANSITELDLAGKSLGMEGALVLSTYLKADTSGSLSKLDLSKNNLRSEGLSVVSEALKSTSIKQLNIAYNNLTYNQQTNEDMSGVIKFAEDMKDMGSLARVDLSGNNGRQAASPDFIRPIANALKTNTSITEINLSNSSLNAEAAKVLSDGIKDARGSLSNLHIGCNKIPEEQMRVFIAMDKLDVLCAVPIKKLKANSITELDLAGKSLGTEGALVLSTYLKADANGSLASLTISHNKIDRAQEANIKQICADKSITLVNDDDGAEAGGDCAQQ